MSGRMNGQRAVLLAAVERMYEGTLPSRWWERDPLTEDLMSLVQPAIAIREAEADRRRHWRRNNRIRWLRDHPGETEVPESVRNAEPRPRYKRLSIARQEYSGRRTIVRKALNNRLVFEKKTENGVRYIRLLTIPGPLRRMKQFQVR